LLEIPIDDTAGSGILSITERGFVRKVAERFSKAIGGDKEGLSQAPGKLAVVRIPG
jgi:hypothetical protein